MQHDAIDRHLSLQESPRRGLRQILVAYPVSSTIGVVQPVSVFVGATRAFPITNANSVRLLSDGGLTSARKNATALKTS